MRVPVESTSRHTSVVIGKLAEFEGMFPTGGTDKGGKAIAENTVVDWSEDRNVLSL
jgi:hypothetical protein